MQYVEGVSRGRVKLGQGTLYGRLKSLVKKKWIEELDGNNPRRRLYRLTGDGRALLEAETQRLKDMSDLGKHTVENPAGEDDAHG